MSRPYIPLLVSLVCFEILVKGFTSLFFGVLAILFFSFNASAETLKAKGNLDPSFSITTLNVQNLPDIKLPFFGIRPFGDRPDFLQKIADRGCGFDIFVIQEDFWHPHLDKLSDCYSELNMASRNTYLTQKDFIASIWNRNYPEKLSDGLSQFSQYPSKDESRVAWTDCHGQIGNGTDCLAFKGFQRVTYDINGLPLDVYNLHMDAGRTNRDSRTRMKQVKQMIRDIQMQPGGHMLIVIGDFNMHGWDKALQKLKSVLKLRSACGNLRCGEDRIDKILYRSATRVKLTPQKYRVLDQFEGLSDHPALQVEFLAISIAKNSDF